ncbi:hypothetical protein VMCG_08644 [Cytospora schulzeri]|uniref:alpha-galactosidase n=1 Tax=Cytospora schulzeri TaxID=448051 RepID=A0A423VTC8_9PEZI|nr:hypothetical protein VMCG_08644 [Valsa malicola]
MELTCDRVKPAENDTEMADLPAAVSVETQLIDVLSLQNQQSNNTTNQPVAPAYHIPAALVTGSEHVHTSHVGHASHIDSDVSVLDSDVNSDGSSSESGSGEEQDSGMDSYAGDQVAEVDSDETGGESEAMQDYNMDSDVDVNNEASHPTDPDGQTESAGELYEQVLLEQGPQHRETYHDPNDDFRSIFVDFDLDQTVFNRSNRGLYKLENSLNHEKHRVTELERMKQYIEAGLEAAQLRQDQLRAAITKSRLDFSMARASVGISDELWREYEALCESLEPRSESRGSAEIPLRFSNFRCEVSIEETLLEKHEYLVEFWPLASPEPRKPYPNLYRLATLAANKPTGGNGHVAQEFFLSLHDQKPSFSGGWLFEYRPEPARAEHPVKLRQWSYRSAHKFDVSADQQHFMGVENVDGSDIQQPPHHLWQPQPSTTWNYVLHHPVHLTDPNLEQSEVWIIDLFDNPTETVTGLHRRGRKVIAYFSAGTRESWRPDASLFPASDLGRAMDGWDGERWVRTGSEGVRRVMLARLDMAAAKGFDGVDPDNVDGYDNKNGLKLTKGDAVEYVLWLTREAHARGLSCGLKNAGDIVPRVVDHMQWCVNEQAVQYGDEEQFEQFVRQGMK